MKFAVTFDEINEGTPNNSCDCPVALAIKEAINPLSVEVEAYYITINSKKYPTPGAVLSFIQAFDDGETVKPFTFELPIEP